MGADAEQRFGGTGLVAEMNSLKGTGVGIKS